MKVVYLTIDVCIFASVRGKRFNFNEQPRILFFERFSTTWCVFLNIILFSYNAVNYFSKQNFS